MYLIIGLGNPGETHHQSRHNLGQIFVNEFAANLGLRTWQADFKLQSSWAKPNHIILAKPLTYVNQSGLAVSRLKNFFKVPAKNIWIIHDDIDLKLGTFKLAYERGSAGHKGVESVIRVLKTKKFHRVRLGIQPPTGKPKNVNDFVLSKFAKGERPLIKGMLERASAKLLETLRL